jgi:phosphate transport system substrate-binding protein
MRNSQQSTPSVRPSSNYFVVKIDKRAALLFLTGLAVIAAVYVTTVREPYDRNKVQAENANTNSAAPAVPPPTENSFAIERAPATPPAPPAAEVVPTGEAPASREAVDSSAPAPQPSPAVTESRMVVTHYSDTPTPLEAPQADSATVGNPAPDPPPDPQPPSNPPPAPNPPAAPYDSTAPAVINGAGAIFPYPLYSKWFDEFHKLHPNVQFNYQAVGSGAGIKQLLENVVEFGGADVPMTDEQLATLTSPVLHVPSVIGAVVPVYNLPEVADLRFTPEILAGIYSGRIANWNDPAIASANPRANLPDHPIVTIHRADGCAATFIFTDYLSKVSMEWQHTIGKGTSVYWPLGIGGKGNEGVAGLLKETPGAIAYVDFLYAIRNKVPFAGVRNQKGNFIKANLESLTAAAAGARIGSDFATRLITNAPGKDSYPISSFTWFLVPQRSRDAAEARDLRAFLRWMLASRSQATASTLGYAPLPEELTSKVESEISRIH